MSDATTNEVLDKVSLILLLSKVSLHNYYSIVDKGIDNRARQLSTPEAR
jgi:hypothetical protein